MRAEGKEARCGEFEESWKWPRPRKKQNDRSKRGPQEGEIREQTVETESEVRVVVSRVVVGTLLRWALKGMAVEADAPVREPVQMAIGRNIPQKERQPTQDQNGGDLVRYSAHDLATRKGDRNRYVTTEAHRP